MVACICKHNRCFNEYVETPCINSNTKNSGHSATTSLGVWKPRCFQTPVCFHTAVFRNTWCFETPGVSKHLVFGNTKTGGSRVSTIFGVSKHFFFTVYIKPNRVTSSRKQIKLNQVTNLKSSQLVKNFALKSFKPGKGLPFLKYYVK